MKTSQPQAVRKLLPKFTKHMYEGIIAMHENIKVPIAKKDNPIKNGQKMWKDIFQKNIQWPQAHKKLINIVS